jgi:hypothetical protein
MDDVAAARRQSTTTGCVCPHIDRDDVRCASRFNISRMDQAFSVCFDSFHGCPMYHRINREQARMVMHNHPAEPPLISITAHGSAITLRPTGT